MSKLGKLVGVPALGFPLPRWLCEEVRSSVPPSVISAIDAARELRTASPHLSLRQLVASSRYPAASYVRIACGCVCSLASPESHTDALLRVSAVYTARPDGRLIPSTCPLGAMHTSVHRASATEVQVWTAVRLAHCEEKREYKDLRGNARGGDSGCGGGTHDGDGQGDQVAPTPAGERGEPGVFCAARF